MNRWIAALASLAFSFSISIKPASLPEVSGYILEGRVMAGNGAPVPAAEVRLISASGATEREALTDITGRYRIADPAVPAEAAKGCRIEIAHPRFRTIRTEDAIGAATAVSVVQASTNTSQPFLLSAGTRTVQRDFVLTPLARLQSGPAAFDPGAPESIYRQALMELESNPKHALELFKLYAQTGYNPKQVERALELMAAGGQRRDAPVQPGGLR